MKKILNFDALFAAWFEKWLAENAAKYPDADALEEAVPEVYAEWLAAPSPQTGGDPPEAYFEGESAEELVATIAEYLKQGVPLSDVLCDTLVRTRGAERALYAELQRGGSGELRAVCMNLLNELDSDLADALYVDWIADPAQDGSIRELAVEILSGSGRAAAVADKLFEKAKRADEETKLLIADVAVRLQGDERAFRLLTELFNVLDDVALCASYLGKFGDERALPMLMSRIEDDNINYAEFLELRNAIERLGGEVTVTRSFENDPVYHALKGAGAEKKPRS